jgi:hypothetical protein
MNPHPSKPSRVEDVHVPVLGKINRGKHGFKHVICCPTVAASGNKLYGNWTN